MNHFPVDTGLDLRGNDPGVITVIQNQLPTDDRIGTINLGTHFFRFYDQNYDQVHVNENGLITLGATNASGSNQNFPSSPASAAIAVLWDDFRIDTSTGRSEVLALFRDSNQDGTDDELVIEWSQVEKRVGSSSDFFDFQAILSLDTANRPGNIVLNYADFSGTSILDASVA